MPDITMCKDKECPLKNECYRYRAIPSEYRQSYFAESPRKADKCYHFWEIKKGMRLQDKKITD